ncbi:MAG: hypothetical protein HW384_1478 [Dehalococcoidia bacterium]|nr:hypothetical protein [Dehalococcoidia bacterium]
MSYVPYTVEITEGTCITIANLTAAFKMLRQKAVNCFGQMADIFGGAAHAQLRQPLKKHFEG